MPRRALVAVVAALLATTLLATAQTTLLLVPAAAASPRPDPLDAVRTALDAPAGAPAELTLALRDLWLARDTLGRSERRAARGLLARPPHPDAQAAWRYPSDAPQVRSCTDRFCLTHVTGGRHAATPAFAEATLTAVAAAWRRVVDDLGYRAPAGDGDEGGDARFDVYLADLSSERGLYGFCAPEHLVSGQHARATSYCVLDNDMAGLGLHPLDALAATAAHEFFHAVQFNYDVAEDPWFMEASATWAEDQVFPHVRDNRQFLAQGQLGRPTTPLDSLAGGYGNWIFVQFLAQRGGVDTVRTIWERLDASTGARDEWSVEGVRRHVTAEGDDWPRVYADFARANLHPSRHYGTALPTAPLNDRLRLGVRTPVRTHVAWLPHLSSRTLRVDLPGNRDRGAVRLELRATRATHARVQVLVHRRDGRVGLRRVDLDTRGRATVRIAGRRVHHLVVLTSHTGAAHRNCGGNTGWACGGDPVGPLRLRVRATLTR